MGTYGISPEEIRDEIESALDGMEGDFDSKTLKEGLKLALGLGKTYAGTTDRCQCDDCETVFQIYKTKKDADNGNFCFKCPKCGRQC